MLKQCSDCQLWYSHLEIEEDQCQRCEEPWRDAEDLPLGLELPNGVPPHWDLLAKMEARPTRFEILLPFSHCPDQSYIAGVIYEGEGRYWYIEGRTSKFKSAVDATSELVQFVDQQRHKMLNDEFAKEFINDV